MITEAQDSGTVPGTVPYCACVHIEPTEQVPHQAININGALRHPDLG